MALRSTGSVRNYNVVSTTRSRLCKESTHVAKPGMSTGRISTFLIRYLVVLDIKCLLKALLTRYERHLITLKLLLVLLTSEHRNTIQL